MKRRGKWSPSIKEKWHFTGICICSLGYSKWTSFWRSSKNQHVLYWKCPQKLIWCHFWTVQGKLRPIDAVDVIVDVQNACNFVDQANINNFCIGDVPAKYFCKPLFDHERRRTSHRGPLTSLWTSKMHLILFVTQYATTFVLETPLEICFQCHFWAVEGNGHPSDVLRDVQVT